MKRSISLLVTLCFLTACALAGAEDQSSMGKPYTNPNLYSTFTERPGPEENYFIYANFDSLVRAVADIHDWHNDDRGRGYYYLAEQALEICRNPEYTDTESQIVQIVYNLAVDKEKRDLDMSAALMNKLNRVKAAKTTEELTALLQEEGFMTGMPFFNGITQTSGQNAYLYVVNVSRYPVLAYLPTVAEGAEPELDKEGTCEKLVRMQYGEEEARHLVEEIARYDLDYPDAVLEWTEKPLVSLQEIRENCLPLYAMLTGVGLIKEGSETQSIYEIQSYDIAAFEALYTDENIETLKAIIALRLYDDAEPYLNQDTLFNTYSDHDGIQLFLLIHNVANIPMNQAYITHYCPEEKWEMAANLFEKTREAMRARILGNTWMSEESKQKAMEKLNDLHLSSIVPPDGSFDCEPLLTALRDCDNLLDAAALGKRFNNRCMIRYAGEKLERSNPYTAGIGVLVVGGQYLPVYNTFCIGAPALSGSFCDSTSRETILGTLGMHIGHELSHGYDALGAMRDLAGTGTLFTDEDLVTFKEKTASIAAHLDKIETGGGYHVMGDQVVYEAMADMTGMCLMLDLAKQEENFDYDAFFRAYAGFSFSYDQGNVYKPNESGRVDPHPPYYVRLNYSVSQFEEFYRTYPSVTEDTPMYIAPEDRILAW